MTEKKHVNEHGCLNCSCNEKPKALPAASEPVANDVDDAFEALAELEEVPM